MSWEDDPFKIRLGLTRPRTAEATQRESELNGMRQAIFKGSYDSHLIRNCLEKARHCGLSGEDTYVLLAYTALLQLEEHFQREMERVKLDPSSPFRFLKTEAL
jgi:hypothetical protein